MSNEITSPKFWISLEQKENPAQFAADTGGEFQSTPVREGFEKEGLGRRDFMKLMGASALMASLAGCSRRPVQKIVPYVNNPEAIIPGLPNFYASACPSTGYGLLVRTREGRPIKVDGNSDHPMNKGSLSARGQAMVHDLYDPDRLRQPKIDGADVSWEDFDKAVKSALGSARGSAALVSATVLSPSVRKQIAKLGIKHVEVDAFSYDDVLDGQAESYGTRLFPRFRFDKADYIVSIDADFLDTWGSSQEYTKQFVERRRLEGKKISMNKLVAFESVMRLTGQNADERYTIHPNDALLVALGLAHAVARQLGRSTADFESFAPAAVEQKTGIPAAVLEECAKGLVRNRGRSLVLASAKAGMGAELQNVVNFLNSSLGNEGETVDASIAPSYQFQGSYAEFESLVQQMKAGQIKALIIQGINPAFVFADSLGFAEALAKVPHVIYVGSYLDETARLAKYVAAESHSFEAWGDVNAQKDLYSIIQPTIQSLWQTKSFLEMLSSWSGGDGNAYELVRAQWQELHKKHGVSQGFTDWWDDILMSGVFHPGAKSYDSSSGGRSFRNEALKKAIAAARNAGSRGAEGEFTLVLTQSVAMGDGFQANNALLQELPDPVTKNTWGNYLMVSPATAKKMGFTDGDILEMTAAGEKFTITMHRQPGLKEGVVAAHLGYGRKNAGRNGSGVGVRLANLTRKNGVTNPVYAVGGVKLVKTGKKEKVPCTQGHHSLEGRDLVFDTTLEEYRENPKSGIVRHFPNPPSLWSEHEYKGYKWGMVIDMNSCTGCSACVIACSIENNVPAVGKDQVQKGREMSWIRIDRYYSGDDENPETLYQAMLCQHCDNAPCETVCPVLATTHSDEGLNQMTYNRCVGTKYCSNNCPYKVRRFNWFNNNGDMNAPMEHPLALSKNPEVTLRSRGVMEKCTFCVQRIEMGKSQAKSEARRANDSDIKTACQEACPADAISFGDMNNPESKVAKLSKHPRGFVSLEELNAKPAVTYLTKVRNRAPRKESGGHGGGHH